MKPRLLDLFCGAGGCSVGYARAGFDVVGVDIEPHPDYPYEFHCADALTFPLDGFDCYHASPPCQAYSTLGRFSPHVEYPDLYDAIKARLVATGKPWVIENVVGAPYASGSLLCGSMFGLKVRRHRNFETSFATLAPSCDHRGQGHPVGVYGHGQFFWENGEKNWRNVPIEEARDAMGIDWMKRGDIAEAVPPAYTEYIGHQLLAAVGEHKEISDGYV